MISIVVIIYIGEFAKVAGPDFCAAYDADKPIIYTIKPPSDDVSTYSFNLYPEPSKKFLNFAGYTFSISDIFGNSSSTSFLASS